LACVIQVGVLVATLPVVVVGICASTVVGIRASTVVGIRASIHVDISLGGEVVWLVSPHHELLLLAAVYFLLFSLLFEIHFLLASSLFKEHAASLLFLLPAHFTFSASIFLELLCPSHICHFIFSFSTLFLTHPFFHLSSLSLLFFPHFSFSPHILFINSSNFILSPELGHSCLLFLSSSFVGLFF
jgi:hypothetical protein